MEYGRVRGFDFRRVDRDVVDTPLRPIPKARLGQQLLCFWLVRWREFEVHRPLSAALQELEADLAHSAPDLEHGAALDSALLEELDHSARRLVEAAPPVALGRPAREARAEELVTAERIAASSHCPSLSPLARPERAVRGEQRTRRRGCRSPSPAGVAADALQPGRGSARPALLTASAKAEMERSRASIRCNAKRRRPEQAPSYVGLFSLIARALSHAGEGWCRVGRRSHAETKGRRSGGPSS